MQGHPRLCNLENDKIISVHFQGKPFSITAIQVYAPITDALEAEVDQFYEYLHDLIELTTTKKKSYLSQGIRMQK